MIRSLAILLLAASVRAEEPPVPAGVPAGPDGLENHYVFPRVRVTDGAAPQGAKVVELRFDQPEDRLFALVKTGYRSYAVGLEMDTHRETPSVVLSWDGGPMGSRSLYRLAVKEWQIGLADPYAKRRDHYVRFHIRLFDIPASLVDLEPAWEGARFQTTLGALNEAALVLGREIPLGSLPTRALVQRPVAWPSGPSLVFLQKGPCGALFTALPLKDLRPGQVLSGPVADQEVEVTMDRTQKLTVYARPSGAPLPDPGRCPGSRRPDESQVAMLDATYTPPYSKWWEDSHPDPERQYVEDARRTWNSHELHQKALDGPFEFAAFAGNVLAMQRSGDLVPDTINYVLRDQKLWLEEHLRLKRIEGDPEVRRNKQVHGVWRRGTKKANKAVGRAAEHALPIEERGFVTRQTEQRNHVGADTIARVEMGNTTPFDEVRLRGHQEVPSKVKLKFPVSVGLDRDRYAESGLSREAVRWEAMAVVKGPWESVGRLFNPQTKVPPPQRLDPDALYDRGTKLMARRADTDSAAAYMTRFIQTAAEGDPRLQRAYLNVAELLRRRVAKPEMDPAFSRAGMETLPFVVDPAMKERAEALKRDFRENLAGHGVAVARHYLNTKAYAPARQELESVVRDYGDTPSGQKAREMLGKLPR